MNDSKVECGKVKETIGDSSINRKLKNSVNMMSTPVMHLNESNKLRSNTNDISKNNIKRMFKSDTQNKLNSHLNIQPESQLRYLDAQMIPENNPNANVFVLDHKSTLNKQNSLPKLNLKNEKVLLADVIKS